MEDISADEQQQQEQEEEEEEEEDGDVAVETDSNCSYEETAAKIEMVLRRNLRLDAVDSNDNNQPTQPTVGMSVRTSVGAKTGGGEGDMSLTNLSVIDIYTFRRTPLTVLGIGGPRAGSGVVRIDPLRFLAGCRTRRLNQFLSVLSLSYRFLLIYMLCC